MRSPARPNCIAKRFSLTACSNLAAFKRPSKRLYNRRSSTAVPHFRGHTQEIVLMTRLHWSMRIGSVGAEVRRSREHAGK